MGGLCVQYILSETGGGDKDDLPYTSAFIFKPLGWTLLDQHFSSNERKRMGEGGGREWGGEHFSVPHCFENKSQPEIPQAARALVWHCVIYCCATTQNSKQEEKINPKTPLAARCQQGLSRQLIHVFVLYTYPKNPGRLKKIEVPWLDVALTPYIPFIVLVLMTSSLPGELSNPAACVQIVLGTKRNINMP